MNEKEIWKPVLGYEGKYQVSNKGQVASLMFVNRRLNYARKNPFVMKQFTNSLGYKRITLCKNNIKEGRGVSIL